MNSAVWRPYAAQSAHGRPLASSVRVGGWLLFFCIFTIAAGWWVPLNNDVSWQYWVARQMRGGTELYRDIIEVNPPLWFWEAIPISWAAERLGIGVDHMVIVTTSLRAAFALWLTWLICRREIRLQMGTIIPALALILCILPIHDIAEREHLMLMGAIPYVALIGCRAGRAPVGRRLSVLTGVVAGYAFALKPHFLLIPIMLEAWLMLGMRGGWRVSRPETIAVAFVMMLYGAAILLFAPYYLTDTIGHALAAYGSFSPSFSDIFVTQPWTLAWIFGGLAMLASWGSLSPQARAAAVATMALGIVFMVQGKGFPYQAMAVSAMLAWTLWLILADGHFVIRNMVMRPLAVLALGLMVVTTIFLGLFEPYRAGRLSDAVDRLPAGSTVAVISAHSWLAFPAVEKGRFVWPLRDIGLWTLPLIAREGEGATMTPRGAATRKRTTDALAADLWCHPPDAILVDDPTRSPALKGTDFDYLKYIASDRRLASLFSHYEAERAGGYQLYRLRDRIKARGTNCRTISIRPE